MKAVAFLCGRQMAFSVRMNATYDFDLDTRAHLTLTWKFMGSLSLSLLK